jgi:hypothetical protein
MIISTNEGGLANRIKSWVSAMRIADDLNIECKVYWKIISNYNNHSHILNCKFIDIFSNNSEFKKITTKNIQRYNSHCLKVFDSDNIPKNFSKFTSNCKRKFSKNDPQNRNFDFEYLRIPENVIQNYLPYFKNIKLHPNLEKKVFEFSKNFDQNTISLHIRSWCLRNEESRQSLHSIKKIKDEMNKYPNKKFFLVSDDNEMSNNFKEYNILKFPRISKIERTNTLSIQEDLIELFLLSKNLNMILSHFSTYSEVAWWLGGCSKNITII